MRVVIAVVLGLLSASYAAEEPRYLPTIQQRWDASDSVCIGLASTPVSTGVIRKIGNRDRDQLSVKVDVERCFKNNRSVPAHIRVFGYSVVASKNAVGGIAYAGPPIGFVRKGRNLLFLCRTGKIHEFEVSVPIYETAVRLADNRPYYPEDHSWESTRFALTQEFEAALVQFDANDTSDIGRILELLGPEKGITELDAISRRVPVPIQRDIAIALLAHGRLDAEPLVISLLQDSSSLVWKRENAAHALGDHGTERAVPYLRQLASEPATTDDQRSFRVWILSAVHRLECRLLEKSCTPPVD